MRTGRQGKRIRTPHLELRVLASPLSHSRVGFIVPKHGRSSAERNRLERRMREIVRTRLLTSLPVVDVVFRVRPTAYDAPFDTLVDELTYGAQAVKRMFQ